MKSSGNKPHSRRSRNLIRECRSHDATLCRFLLFFNPPSPSLFPAARAPAPHPLSLSSGDGSEITRADFAVEYRADFRGSPRVNHVSASGSDARRFRFRFMTIDRRRRSARFRIRPYPVSMPREGHR